MYTLEHLEELKEMIKRIDDQGRPLEELLFTLPKVIGLGIGLPRWLSRKIYIVIRVERKDRETIREIKKMMADRKIPKGAYKIEKGQIPHLS